MIWLAKAPTKPGYSWLAGARERAHIVEVNVELDSRGMFFVRLPDDKHKYPFDLCSGARWLGPLEAPP